MVGSRVARIGLTGGIGSGKSTVSAILAGLGATLVDTDAISRALTLPGGAAMPAVQAQFGDGFIDAHGAMNRPRMRELVFADAQAKRRLEAIIHPLIGIEVERQIETAAGTALVFDVPLLAESTHWRARVDRVLVVDCSTETQIQRVMMRSGWTREAVQAVIDQQTTREMRRACADVIVFNDGLSLEQLAIEITQWWSSWRGRAPG